MEIGKEDSDVASGVEEFCDLDHRDEVPAVRSACRGRSPIDLEVSLLIENHIVDDFRVEDFGQVGLD